MKRIALLALVAAGLLALAGTAQAKEIMSLKICGASGCKESTGTLALGDEATSVSYTQPAPFYAVELGFGDGQTVLHREDAYWLPGANLMRFKSEVQPSWWTLSASAVSGLHDVASGIDAFTPSLSRVTVGGRAVADPTSYLALMGRFHFAVLPKGKLHLVRIVLSATEPNPWVDRKAVVSYDAKRRLLIRSDGYFRIPVALGKLVMRRASLASTTSTGSGGGHTALYAGVGAGAFVALGALAVVGRKRMH